MISFLLLSKYLFKFIIMNSCPLKVLSDSVASYIYVYVVKCLLLGRAKSETVCSIVL